MRLEVRVIPRASRNEILVRDGILTLRVTAPPVDSAANAAVQEALAAALVAEAGSLSATGRCPANTNGGDLAGGYSHGFRHIVEAARQVTGRAHNQVVEAETAMVMGASVGPTSGAILRRREMA